MNDTATDTVTDTPDLDALVDGYLAGWNATDPAERTAIVERVWSPDARMSDPLVDVTGHEALVGVFALFHATYPGCTFRRAGAHDAHHDLVRWGWEMIDANGAVVLDGIDVAVVSADGRLHRVAGFFGATIPA